MAVALRLKRMGNTHRPFYRIVSVDKRDKRDGAVIEQLGTYNPLDKDEQKQVDMDRQRVAYWISVGAQPSITVAGLCKRVGLDPKPGTKVEAQHIPDEPATPQPAAAPTAGETGSEQAGEQAESSESGETASA
jgi:small subunit ribosomal protein S16